MKSSNIAAEGQFGSPYLSTGALYGEDLLRALRRRPISQEIRVLYQIGAHKFEEKALLHRIFTKLEKSVLFEPNPELCKKLAEQTHQDKFVTVLPFAISDKDGETIFHIASNDGLSSSLLEFGTHKQTFPNVVFEKSIPVQVRKLSTVVKEFSLPLPDFLFIDTQGAEYQVLSGISAEILEHVKLIYVEASIEELYRGAKLLNDVKELLAPGFLFVGYAPQERSVPNHGNAVFVNQRYAHLAKRNYMGYLLKRFF